MTSEPSFADCEVVNVISHCRCERARAEVKRDLNRTGPVTVETLDHHCGAAQDQSLWQAEFQHAQKDEQKVHRHSAGDPGEMNLQPCSQNRDQEVADELGNIFACRVDGCVEQHTCANRDDKADKSLGAKVQVPPRLRLGSQVSPCDPKSRVRGIKRCPLHLN